MKKITLLLSAIFMLISGYRTDAQCTITGDLNFTTQAELDAWTPPCSNVTVTGFLNIQGSGITDISKLQNIVQVNSFLQLRSIDVTSLSDISNITTVGDSFVLRDCDNLASIAALNITSIGNDITIRDNDILTSLNGLENSGAPGRAITIYNNNNLTNINALNYGNLNGTLQISTNPSLASLGTLSSITSSAGNIEILNNTALTDISGLSGLTNLTGGLFIRDNVSLANLSGLDNLTDVVGGLDVQDNTALKNLCGLNAIVASTNYASYVVTGNGYNPVETDFPANCEDPTLSTENFEILNVSFYPNPITGNQITLKIQNEGKFSICNIIGKVIQEGELTRGDNIINVSQLHSGLFIIKINDNLGASKSIKVLKK